MWAELIVIIDSTLLDHLSYKIGAEAVAEMAVIGNTEQDQVSLFAGFDRANLSGALDRGGRIDRGRGDGRGWSQAQGAAGQGDHKRHTFTPGSARVNIGGDSQQAAGFKDGLSRGISLFGQTKRCAGQSDRYCLD